MTHFHLNVISFFLTGMSVDTFGFATQSEAEQERNRIVYQLQDEGFLRKSGSTGSTEIKLESQNLCALGIQAPSILGFILEVVEIEGENCS